MSAKASAIPTTRATRPTASSQDRSGRASRIRSTFCEHGYDQLDASQAATSEPSETDKLKIIADAATDELRLATAIVDGELVYPHETGFSDFHALQAVVRSSSDKLVFMAFDLLHLDGADLREEPVEERRELLEALIRPSGRIQFSDSLQGTPAELFAAIECMGLEGIVCKKRGSRYATPVSRMRISTQDG